MLLTLDAQLISAGVSPYEPGGFRLGFDERAAYLRVDCVDRDITTTATADHDILYTAGDVAEWFIGVPPAGGAEGKGGDSCPGVPRTPDSETSSTVNDQGHGPYLELHISPNGLRSAYMIPSPGVLDTIDPIPFAAEVAVHAALNGCTPGWSAQFSLPWLVLQQLDATLSPDTGINRRLTTLIGRYNYGQHLPRKNPSTAGLEFTMWPTQPRTYFHLRAHHAPILFDEMGPPDASGDNDLAGIQSLR